MEIWVRLHLNLVVSQIGESPECSELDSLVRSRSNPSLGGTGVGAHHGNGVQNVLRMVLVHGVVKSLSVHLVHWIITVGVE